MPQLTEQTKPWFGMPFMTSSQEMEWTLFLQLGNPHAASICRLEVFNVCNYTAQHSVTKQQYVIQCWTTMHIAYFFLLDFAGFGVKSQQGAPSRELWVHQLQNGLCCKLFAFTFVLASNLNTVIKLV